MKLELPTPFEVEDADQDNEKLLPASLENGSLGDWFIHVEGKPRLYFNELLKLCSNILACGMTEKYAPAMYLAGGLQFEEKPVTLKEYGFSGAKRVNVASGEYTDIGDPLPAILTGQPQTFTERRTEQDQFFMHGKDDSCLVEGTWYDWLCLVGNILASETVKENYPTLYQPQLANDNY